MCLICKDFQLGKLTYWEAKVNLQEMSGNLSPEHYEETLKLINMSTPDPFDDQDYTDTDRMD